MKKRILTLLLLLFATKSIACKCDMPQTIDGFIKSDFVAKAKIIKTYQNDGAQAFYKADIITDEIFKGVKADVIYVFGNNNTGRWNSCGITVKDGMELILYAKKDKSGRLVLGPCSATIFLTNEVTQRRKDKIDRELQILSTLKEKIVYFTDDANSYNLTNLSRSLERFRGIKLKKDFAIIEMTFNAEIRVKEVNVVSGFDNRTNKKLIKLLTAHKWILNKKDMERGPTSENRKLIIAIYYYPAQGNDESFLSPYNF